VSPRCLLKGCFNDRYPEMVMCKNHWRMTTSPMREEYDRQARLVREGGETGLGWYLAVAACIEQVSRAVRISEDNEFRRAADDLEAAEGRAAS
jgi:hypothetical protein